MHKQAPPTRQLTNYPPSNLGFPCLVPVCSRGLGLRRVRTISCPLDSAPIPVWLLLSFRATAQIPLPRLLRWGTDSGTMSWSERGTLPLSLKACPPCPDRPHLHGVTLPWISRTTALGVSKPCFYPGGFPRMTRQNQTTFLSAVHSTKQAARPAGEAPCHRSRRPQPGQWPMPTREALSLYLCRGGVLRGRVLERKGSRCVCFIRLLH